MPFTYAEKNINLANVAGKYEGHVILVQRLEGILQLRVSSHHASLWLPFSRIIQELG